MSEKDQVKGKSVDETGVQQAKKQSKQEDQQHEQQQREYELEEDPPMPPAESIPNVAHYDNDSSTSSAGVLLSVESSDVQLDEQQTYLRKIYVDADLEGEDEQALELAKESQLLGTMSTEKVKLASELSTLKTQGRDSLEFFLEADYEEAKEETTELEEQPSQHLNRAPYLHRFTEAMVEYGYVKRLNNYLHKKMAEYFKKRKMEHVLKEVEHAEDAAIKYGKKLDNFAILIEYDEKQRLAISNEIKALENLKDKQCSKATDNFIDMLRREQEIGTGLISTKTGKEMPEKYLDKLISNQRNKAKELQQLRLIHIKIRNAVTEKSGQIRALDKIGENYTLMEYEQLKIENQGHMDKIEERDDELSRLRKKCQGAIQCLAHVREKCSALEQNIQSMKELLTERERETTNVRETMNKLKQQRDWFRLETQRLREENGLLTKDKLLIDMEEAMKAITDLKDLKRIKSESLAEQKRKLNCIKMNFEREMRRRKHFLLDKNFDKNHSKKPTLKLKQKGHHHQIGGHNNFFGAQRASLFKPQYERKTPFKRKRILCRARLD